MTTDNSTEAARIIDAHRENERRVGDGVKIECVCGHTSHATYDFSGPITEDKNNHRDAERMHASHVAQVLTEQELTDAEAEAAEEAIDAIFGWEHLRRYGGQNEEWMNRLRKTIARAALSAARAARRDEENR